MNLAGIAIEKRAVTYFFCVILVIGGIASFFSLGWLEDPTFTIKKATVVTQYPGASPEEVEQEVTDRLEKALQELPQLKSVYSYSRAGLSIIFIEIKKSYWADRLPQVWQELRNKINDATAQLPPGAGTPDVSDDFGFVYGFLMALTGEGYSYAELEDYAESLQKELAVVPGVARVELWGVQDRVVYVDISQRQLSQLGLAPADLSQTLVQQNMVVDAGSIDVRDQRYRIAPTGTFSSPEDIEELTFAANIGSDIAQLGGEAASTAPSTTVSAARNPSRTQELIKVKDIADVTVGYLEPPRTIMRFNGRPAIALALANVEGGNIVETGTNIDRRLAELEQILPVGIEISRISWQSNLVEDSIKDFMINLAQAVAIVLVVLSIAMGWRMGLIIGSGLILTILGTFILMAVFGIDLHRMSLGALVIALGMMVDNSIVVADGFVVRLQKGMDRNEAAMQSANLPAWPLLAATIIAVLAFYPIFASTDDAGEYCQDLFTVVAFSLLFSWVISMMVTPVQCIDMLPAPKQGKGGETEQYSGGFYDGFRRFLSLAIRAKFPFVGTMIALLVVAMIGFTTLPQQFFPDSARAQFLVDYWAPEGTRIQTVSEDLTAIEEKLLEDERVTSVSTFIGQGPPRFYLPVDSELPFESYANVVVNTKSGDDVPGVVAEIEPWMNDTVPQALTRVRLYGLGPSDTWKFEARFSGPYDADVALLRELGEKGKAILENTPLAKEIRTDMRNRVLRLEPVYNDERGRWANVSREHLASSTKRAFDGLDIGLYREGDDLLPIKLRMVEDERNNLGAFDVVQVSNPLQTDTVPLSQVVNNVRFEWEDPLIMRYQRRRVNTVQASPSGVTFPTLRDAVLEEFENIALPPGYDLFWDGEALSTEEAQASLIPGIVPVAVIVLFLIVYLFNAFRPPIIIISLIPFIFIGISPALMATQVPFGFVALLGAMSLAGMMIKNAIVLLDQVNIELEAGRSRYDAIVEAAVSRLRPVALAAATTVLGVAPLLQDVFWVGMSITIMSGLTMGTLLTLILLPVLYAIFYGVRVPRAGMHEAPAT